MEGIVTFYNDQEGWYHAYNNDAIVVSNILGYKLFERYNQYNGKVAIGFEKQYLRKVTKALMYHNIGYSIYDYDITIEYANSKYNKFLNSDYVKADRNRVFNNINNYITRNIITGFFTIQYNDEKPISREIGVNINQKADIINIVANGEVGNSYQYGEDMVKIISKNLAIETINVPYYT